mmetsp:Transcript_39175/g.113104  ORF Transcript_39175/g.113104 Transcript_39175/m.113104 type:complete len:209 (+) Transcript_39175:497-1123(+)
MPQCFRDPRPGMEAGHARWTTRGGSSSLSLSRGHGKGHVLAPALAPLRISAPLLRELRPKGPPAAGHLLADPFPCREAEPWLRALAGEVEDLHARGVGSVCSNCLFQQVCVDDVVHAAVQGQEAGSVRLHREGEAWQVLPLLRRRRIESFDPRLNLVVVEGEHALRACSIRPAGVRAFPASPAAEVALPDDAVERVEVARVGGVHQEA